MSSTTLIPDNVIHEAIDERQHVRTRIPAKVILSGGGLTGLECDIQDISLGGIGLIHAQPLKLGTLMNASIKLRLAKLDLNIDAKLKIVSQRDNEVGAQFVELDAQKRDILRYIISSYMSGEIADINGLFNVMQRENYIKERKQKHALARTPLDRLKAAAGTLAFSLIGLAALGIVSYKAYLLFFRIPAAQATVSADAYVLTMPENGYVKYLLKPGQRSVTTGEPLASISTQLATSFTSPADMAALSNLAPGDVQALLNRATVETLINSPCDCDLYFPSRRLDGFNYKQAPLVHLLPKDEDLVVRASVPFAKLPDMNRVRAVDMSVYGSDQVIAGKIVASSVDAQTQSVVLTLKPEQPLPREAYQQPVAVDFYLGLPLLGATR